MLKLIVLGLVTVGAYFLAFMVWPQGVMTTAFHLGTVSIPWLAIILLSALIIALKAK